MTELNYKHLHYFWVVAKNGTIARASEQLHLTPQTISGQLGQFEEVLGQRLFARIGRRLELTDTGRAVLAYAEEIFTLGEALKSMLEQGPGARPQQFRVGVSDFLPKAIVFRLIEPARMLPEPMRLVCREGRLSTLLADLAIHKLDVVISDSPMPSNVDVRGFSHLLGESGMTFFSSPQQAAHFRDDFPRSLDGAPMLLPGEDTVVRARLLQWLATVGVRPRIVGEFEDSALLKAFGEAGAGIFAVPTVTVGDVERQYVVEQIGSTLAVRQPFYVISVERRIRHPAVLAIREAAALSLGDSAAGSAGDSAAGESAAGESAAGESAAG